jgi:hypothetical protein
MSNSKSSSFKLINTFKVLALCLFITSLSSCAFDVSSDKEETPTEQQGKEYTSAYICPMHCEDSGSETEGSCPTCGMDYVKNDADSHEGHDAHEDHEH